MTDLKKVYKASTLEQAELEFGKVKAAWKDKYQQDIGSWEEHWLELTAYFSYPTEIRKIIYTTNTVEGFHRQLRKVTKTKTAYPTDNSLKKILYLATMDAIKKWNKPIPGWLECEGQFKIIFEGRIQQDYPLFMYSRVGLRYATPKSFTLYLDQKDKKKREKNPLLFGHLLSAQVDLQQSLIPLTDKVSMCLE